MEDNLARVRRRSKLGKLGEILAAEALARRGFRKIRNLNDGHNQRFADLLAERDGHRYFISVKTRNEERDIGGLNESYHCVLVADAENRMLKAQGMSTEQITALVLRQVQSLASQFDAIPAWITVPARPIEGTYAAYFGLLTDLGNRRDIPMTFAARANYECLIDWTADPRITPDLTNRRRDPAKNEANLRKHGISLDEAKHIFDGPVLTRADDRQDYGENRDITLGALSPEAVLVVVHAERRDKIRLISARKANRRETKVYHDHLAQAQKGNRGDR